MPSDVDDGLVAVEDSFQFGYKPFVLVHFQVFDGGFEPGPVLAHVLGGH